MGNRIQKEDTLPPHLIDVDFLSEVMPDMVNLKTIAPPYRLFRYDKADDRYYFRYQNQKPIGYLSMTSFTKKVLPTSPYLIKWMLSLGEENAIYQRDMRAEYGTLTHCITSDLEKEGKGSWEDIYQRAFDDAIAGGYKTEALEWANEAVNDVFSYMVFRKERNVKTIASEFPICSDEFGLAGCIDRIVELDFNGSRVNAIVDYKSGRKGFWDSHILQLHGYKELWNDLFGDVFPVTHVFNLAPAANSLKAKTKFKLQNQTDAKLSGETVPVKEYVRDLLAMAKKRGMVNPPLSHWELRGAFDLETFEPDSHIFKQEI